MPNIKGFKEAVEPAIKWLNENCHPHNYIIISPTNAELVEGQQLHLTHEFLRD